jgi:hypothetical protein
MMSSNSVYYFPNTMAFQVDDDHMPFLEQSKLNNFKLFILLFS